MTLNFHIGDSGQRSPLHGPAHGVYGLLSAGPSASLYSIQLPNAEAQSAGPEQSRKHVRVGAHFRTYLALPWLPTWGEHCGCGASPKHPQWSSPLGKTWVDGKAPQNTLGSPRKNPHIHLLLRLQKLARSLQSTVLPREGSVSTSAMSAASIHPSRYPQGNQSPLGRPKPVKFPLFSRQGQK